MITPANTTPAGNSNQTKRAAQTSTQSLNHLLNFSLPPRQAHYPQSIPRRARRTGGNHHVWNKERFINAQYRFVMNPNGDYTVHFADPDIYYQWQDILQVIVPRGPSLSTLKDLSSRDDNYLSCPICLSPPTAPRMTKCGHIYCYPCILHLLSTSDQPKWVKCPICLDSVSEWQLKAVKWLDEANSQDEPDDVMEGSSSSTSADHNMPDAQRPGFSLRMRLIQRPQITTLALPRSSTWPSDLLPPHQAPFHFLPDVLLYAKFMLATPSDLVQELTKDLDDLALERRLLMGMGDELGTVFIDTADAKVRRQIEKATALDTPFLRETVDTARHVAQQLVERSNCNRQRREDKVPATIGPEEVPQAYLAAQGSGYATPQRDVAATPQSSRNPRQRRNLNPPPPSSSSYYYYQATNGHLIFLHPLDIRILLAHFQSYPSFPDEITIRVESYTESTVNDDLRKRCKYLAHLPEGADVIFVEADLTNVVGPEGIKAFEGPLRLRRTKRKDKGRRDDKARVRAEEREKERLAQTWSRFGERPSTFQSVPAVPFDGTPAPIRGQTPEETEQDTPAPQTVPGAWGARSFASAAHAAQGRAQGHRAPVSHRGRERAEDEWELDVAFHELEQRSVKGGGKKRGNKMVVLGGGGGRRAR